MHLFIVFFFQGYVVIVTEDLTNKSYRSEKYNGTRNLKLFQTLGPLKRGGVYTVVIQRDVKEAKNPRPSDPMKIHAGKSLLINFQLSKYSEVTSCESFKVPFLKREFTSISCEHFI